MPVPDITLTEKEAAAIEQIISELDPEQDDDARRAVVDFTSEERAFIFDYVRASIRHSLEGIAVQAALDRHQFTHPESNRYIELSMRTAPTFRDGHHESHALNNVMFGLEEMAEGRMLYALDYDLVVFAGGQVMLPK